MDSPEKDTPGCYPNKFSRSSYSSHSDVSLEGKEDKRDKKGFKSKKDQGYSHLERASSEEELVDGQSKSKPKKSTKVFGKLKSKSKAASSVDEKLGSADKKSHSKHHGSKGSKVGSDVLCSPSREIQPSFSNNRPVFGLPLRHAIQNNPCHDGVPVPAVFRMCVDYINENGLKVEGIYRLSPPKSQLDELKQLVDSGVLSLQYDCSIVQDPLCAASLLKAFLRELPDDLLTADLRAEFEQISEKTKSSQECVSRLKDLLNHLPEPNRILLALLFNHMRNVIDNSEYNKMTLPNVGLVLQLVLNWSQALLNVFLQHSHALFSDIKIKRYVPPIKANSSKLSMEFPNNVKDIDEELTKQESLLNYLHDDIKLAAAVDPKKEEQLWDVQRLVTQLKRELKKLKKHYQNSPLPFSDHANVESQLVPCLEMFEEKQLLAVQTELREGIEAEEKLILALMEKIKCSKAKHTAANKQQQPTESRTENLHSTEPGAEDNNNNNNISDDEWLRRCEIEEKRKETLLSQIVEERHLCARLKAQIEMLQLQRQEGFEATRL